MCITSVHNHAIVQVVVTILVHRSVTVPSGPSHSSVPLPGRPTPCYLSSHPCTTPASLPHPQVSMCTLPSLESTPYLELGGISQGTYVTL